MYFEKCRDAVMLAGRELTNYEDIRRIAESVGERTGWDFSRVRDEREPMTWDYVEVVRRYLRPRQPEEVHIIPVLASRERFVFDVPNALPPHLGQADNGYRFARRLSESPGEEDVHVVVTSVLLLDLSGNSTQLIYVTPLRGHI